MVDGDQGFTDLGRPLYGGTPPGGATPCARDTPLSAAEVGEVAGIIAAGRLERRAAQLPERLRTRDWPSVMQVMLALDHRLGRAGLGWKIGAASEEIRRAEGVPGPSPGIIYQDTAAGLTVTLLLAGVTLATGHGGGLYWLPAAFVLAIVIAAINAWVLLVEVLR
jgi:hypothetical protein